MVAKFARKKRNAKMIASIARKAGLNASVFKKKKGYGISVTRNK